MKNLVSFTLAVVAALALATSTASATVVYTSDFSSGTDSWFKGGNTGTLTGGSGLLTWTENGNSMDEVIARSFSAQTLSVGQTIRLTFNYSQSGSTTNNIIRAGLYQTANSLGADNWAGGNATGSWQGYATFVRDNSASGNVARVDNGTGSTGTVGPTQGTASASNPTVVVTTITSPANTTQFNINDSGTTYDVVFQVTYTSVSQMNTLFTLSSGATTHFSVTGNTSTIYNTFNGMFLKQAGGSAMPAIYSNIQLEVIPEPATLGLAALGALALVGFCRKK